MARPKKPKYEYVERLNLYRKRIKDIDGKYTALYGKTPDELEQKVRSAEAAIAEKLEAKEDPLVKDYAAQWLALVTKDMGDKNRELHESAMRLHILPIIGGLRIRDVRPDDVRRVMLELSGRSASLQGKVLNAMRNMFDAAIDNDIITKNPCAKLKNNGKKAKEKTALTAEQTKTLLEAVKGTRAEAFIMLGLYTGMRREEILGLKWDCVSLSGPTPYIIVKRALRWKNSQPVVDDVLKSSAASRTIPIPQQLTDHLKALKPKDGHVVGGAPLSQTQFKNLWRVITNRQTGDKTYTIPYSGRQKTTFTRKKGEKSRGGDFYYTIDFEVSPHILRHTYITNLILSGADIKTVQYLAGHADVSITLNTYTHLIDKSPAKLMADVDKAFAVKSVV